MVGDDVFEEVEPEERELGEDLAFVGDSAAQDVVEGGDAVGGDEEELIAGEGVDVADLAARGEGKGAEVGLEKSCRHHVDGTTSWSMETVEWCLVKRENLVDRFRRPERAECGQWPRTVFGVAGQSYGRGSVCSCTPDR